MSLLRRLLILGLVILAPGIILDQTAVAQTSIGLHVTQEELNIWRQRAQSGPYKSAGDVQTNSPGDWDRIILKKNTFNSNPSAQRWAGQTSASCWINTPGGNGVLPSRTQGENILAAAFYSLVTGDATSQNNVRDELLAQAAMPGTQWVAPQWVASSSCADGDDASFDIVNWLTKLLFAYDYIRSSLTTTQRSTLDAWFLSAATLWEAATDHIIEVRFPNRDTDDYATLGVPTTCDFTKVTHYGGYNVCMWWMEAWNNRNSTHERFSALVGIMQNNATLKAKAKRYFKEALTYVTFPDSTIKEYDRWETNNPALGWTYAGLFIGALQTMADTFARNGDFELYNYSTSAGISAHGTAGGPKSLGQMITLFQQHVNHSVLRYGTDQAGNNGNINYAVDSIDNVSGENYADDHYFAQGNVFYKSNFNKTIYMRTVSGAPAYPSNYSTGGWTAFTGEWGVYPAPLLMFGQMEGKVWPYPTGGSQLPSINFAALPNTIAQGQSSVLTWSISNATSCTGSGGWTGTIAISGTQTVTPAQSTTYTLSCTGSSGSATQSITVTVFAPPNSNGTIAINSGGPDYTATDGTIYLADVFYSGGSTYSSGDSIINTSNGSLYQTERYGDFSYAIPVVNGDYTLSLQFAEIYWGAAGQRMFDVFIEGTQRISSLDIYAVVGKDTAYDTNLPVTVNDGVLNLDFRTDIDNAKLSALKLTKVSTPPSSPTSLTVLLGP
jgi:malectin (di-glucose binding ER protein)